MNDKTYAVKPKDVKAVEHSLSIIANDNSAMQLSKDNKELQITVPMAQHKEASNMDAAMAQTIHTLLLSKQGHTLIYDAHVYAQGNNKTGHIVYEVEPKTAKVLVEQLQKEAKKILSGGPDSVEQFTVRTASHLPDVLVKQRIQQVNWDLPDCGQNTFPASGVFNIPNDASRFVNQPCKSGRSH